MTNDYWMRSSEIVSIYHINTKRTHNTEDHQINNWIIARATTNSTHQNVKSIEIDTFFWRGFCYSCAKFIVIANI